MYMASSLIKGFQLNFLVIPQHLVVRGFSHMLYSQVTWIVDFQEVDMQYIKI